MKRVVRILIGSAAAGGLVTAAVALTAEAARYARY